MIEKEGLMKLADDEVVSECISENLRKCRQKSHMTMTNAARAAGVSRQSIGMYENNKRFPRVKVLLILSAVYQVTLEELIGYDEIQKYMQEK